MLIGIVYSSDKKVIQNLAEGLKRGLEEQGHTTRIYPDDTPSVSGIGACKTLFVGSYVTPGFKPKTPAKLADFLSKTTGIAGKRSVAFLKKGGLGERKALSSLMRDMERQGCYLVDQRVFSSQEEAYRFGKQVVLK